MSVIGIGIYRYQSNFTPNNGQKLGSYSQLDPVECTDEGGGGKEISGEWGGNEPPVLDAAELIFNFVASSFLAILPQLRKAALILDLLAHFLAVVSLVGGDGQWRSGSIG